MPLAIFDLDGTLVDQEEAARLWARGFAETWMLGSADRDSIAVALTERRPKGEVFSELVQRFELPVTPGVVWDDYRARMPALVRCSDADREALRELRRAGWVLGIATNGMADNQLGKITGTGLSELVDGWVISSEIGARKPDPSIFQELARRLRVPLDGWMIGDSLEMDVVGGAGVGLRTAWITPSSSLGEPTPTITATTVASAVHRILELGASGS